MPPQELVEWCLSYEVVFQEEEVKTSLENIFLSFFFFFSFFLSSDFLTVWPLFITAIVLIGKLFMFVD